MKKVVIAGNYWQYTEWLKLNKVDSRVYKYIKDSEQVRGLEFDEIIYVGTYYRNPAYNHLDILHRLQRYNGKISYDTTF